MTKKLVSSDTCVWIDFYEIDALDLPFSLPYSYIMFEESVDAEMLSFGLKEQLLSKGLITVDFEDKEIELVDYYSERYSKLSVYDCAALAIAKNRKLTLFTSDGPLRKAAKNENVPLIGTIGILDELLESGKLSEAVYQSHLKKLMDKNGGTIRLPQDELLKRFVKTINNDKKSR